MNNPNQNSGTAPTHPLFGGPSTTQPTSAPPTQNTSTFGGAFGSSTGGFNFGGSPSTGSSWVSGSTAFPTLTTPMNFGGNTGLGFGGGAAASATSFLNPQLPIPTTPAATGGTSFGSTSTSVFGTGLATSGPSFPQSQFNAFGAGQSSTAAGLFTQPIGSSPPPATTGMMGSSLFGGPSTSSPPPVVSSPLFGAPPATAGSSPVVFGGQGGPSTVSTPVPAQSEITPVTTPPPAAFAVTTPATTAPIVPATTTPPSSAAATTPVSAPVAEPVRIRGYGDIHGILTKTIPLAPVYEEDFSFYADRLIERDVTILKRSRKIDSLTRQYVELQARKRHWNECLNLIQSGYEQIREQAEVIKRVAKKARTHDNYFGGEVTTDCKKMYEEILELDKDFTTMEDQLDRVELIRRKDENPIGSKKVSIKTECERIMTEMDSIYHRREQLKEKMQTL